MTQLDLNVPNILIVLDEQTGPFTVNSVRGRFRGDTHTLTAALGYLKKCGVVYVAGVKGKENLYWRVDGRLARQLHTEFRMRAAELRAEQEAAKATMMNAVVPIVPLSKAIEASNAAFPLGAIKVKHLNERRFFAA